MCPFYFCQRSKKTLLDFHTRPKLHSEDIFVEVSTKVQRKALLRLTAIVDVKVSAIPYCTLNTIRPVLSEEVFLYTSGELLDELKSSGVVDVKRIVFRKNVENIPSKHVILTFERHALPGTVKAGYLNCRICSYIATPSGVSVVSASATNHAAVAGKRHVPSV